MYIFTYIHIYNVFIIIYIYSIIYTQYFTVDIYIYSVLYIHSILEWIYIYINTVLYIYIVLYSVLYIYISNYLLFLTSDREALWDLAYRGSYALIGVKDGPALAEEVAWNWLNSMVYGRYNHNKWGSPKIANLPDRVWLWFMILWMFVVEIAINGCEWGL